MSSDTNVGAPIATTTVITGLSDAFAANKDQATVAVNDMFQKVSLLLKNEAALCASDYSLLEEMNLLAAERYALLADGADGLKGARISMQHKYAELQSHLHRLSAVEANLAELMVVVALLDDYTKRLEEKFLAL